MIEGRPNVIPEALRVRLHTRIGLRRWITAQHPAYIVPRQARIPTGEAVVQALCNGLLQTDAPQLLDELFTDYCHSSFTSEWVFQTTQLILSSFLAFTSSFMPRFGQDHPPPCQQKVIAQIRHEGLTKDRSRNSTCRRPSHRYRRESSVHQQAARLHCHQPTQQGPSLQHRELRI